MPQAKSRQFETQNFTCEMTVPPDPEKYSVELMFTATGWHTTVALKPEELRRFVMFCDKLLKSSELKNSYSVPEK